MGKIISSACDPRCGKVAFEVTSVNTKPSRCTVSPIAAGMEKEEYGSRSGSVLNLPRSKRGLRPVGGREEITAPSPQ